MASGCWLLAAGCWLIANRSLLLGAAIVYNIGSDGNRLLYSWGRGMYFMAVYSLVYCVDTIRKNRRDEIQTPITSFPPVQVKAYALLHHTTYSSYY